MAGGSVELLRGKDGVFDVFKDGRRIFSKKSAGRFPTHEEILGQL